MRVIAREPAAAASSRPARAGPGSRATAALLAALVVASVVAIDPWGASPFGPLRFLVVPALVLAALATCAGRIVTLQRTTAIVFLALLAWLFVATMFAVDPLHAWIGTPERRLGWLTWPLFAGAFVAGQSLTRDRDGMLIGRAAAIAGIALGAYTIAELGGVAPVDVEFASSRAGGPFGQPAYLGAVSALLLPIAVGLAFERAQPRSWRVLAAPGALGAAIALGAAQARAAWVGIALAALVALPRVAPALGRRKVLVALGVAGFVVLAVVTPLGSRALSTFDGSDSTARSRIDEWQVASRALADRPVLGAGPEGYRVVFGAHVDRDYERRYGREVLPDRAHNGLLDVGAAGGVPALVLAAALLGFVVVAAVRALRAGPVWLAGFGAGVLAYVVQQQFLFPLAEVDPAFWVCAGVLVARTTSPYAQRQIRIARVLASLAIVALIVLVAFGAREIAADHELEAAMHASERGDHQAALAAADRATTLRPDSIRNWYAAARIAESGGSIRDVDAALDRIDEGLERAPDDPALRTERAALALERARRSGIDSDLTRATDDLEALVDDDPNHAGHHLQLGVAYALAARDTDAATEFRIAADLAPNSDAPRQNLEQLAP